MKKTALVLSSVIFSSFLGVSALLADEGDMQGQSELKRLADKQDKILQELDEIKAELQIVKIRVSSR